MGKISIIPPENAQFVSAYNAIIESCQKRGFCLDKPKKKSSDAVMQTDMDHIRSMILANKDLFFIASALTDEILALDDPFGDERVKPVLNPDKDGKQRGFLMVPGSYISSGADVFTTGNFSGSVPVLWEHFDDLIKIINSLVDRKCEYSLNLKITPENLKIDVNILQGTSVRETVPSATYDSSQKTAKHSWQITYTPLPEHPHRVVASFDCYHRLTSKETVWKKLSGLSKIDDVEVVVKKVLPAVKYSEAPADWDGNCRVLLTCHIDDELKESDPGFIKDDKMNGVAKFGCAYCCDPVANPYKFLKKAMASISGKIEVPLALSVPDGDGLQIAHYMTTYSYAGSRYGQYNCDTCVEATFTGSGTDANGTAVDWKFCLVRRPSGALVPFYWKNSSVGTPMNKLNYRIESDIKSRGNEKLFFSDKVIHIGQSLAKCQYNGQEGFYEATLPGRKVTITGSGTSFEFHCVTTGTAKLTTNAHKVPLSYDYVPDKVKARSTVQSDHDQIARITTGDTAADASGFSYDVFFLQGQAPDFGTPKEYSIMNFYNSSEVLIGKYVETAYTDGTLARGYWRRENGLIEPSELTIFDRTPDEDDKNIIQETTTVIKHGASGRQEAVTRRIKKIFPFGEQVVKEFRKYGTPEEQQAVYEYGSDPYAGNFGQLLSSIDFDGSWLRYEYDSRGRLTKVIEPFMDAPFDSADDACKVTSYSYSPLREDEDIRENDTRARTVVTCIQGTEISRKYQLFFEYESWSISAAYPAAPYDATENLVDKSFYYPPGEFQGWLWKIESHTGSSTLVHYVKQNFEIEFDGEETYNLETRTFTDYGVNQSIVNITMKDEAGNVLASDTYDLVLNLQISGTSYVYDQYGRVTRETTIDGDVTTTEYNCCGPRFVTDPNGNVTEYSYDAFNRLTFSARNGVTTYHSYDVLNNEIQTTLQGKDGGELVTVSEYDPDGVLLSQTTPGNATTVYEAGAGYEIVTDALGGTTRTDYYLDKQPKSVSGSAAYSKTTEYGIENGELYSKVISSANEWVKSYTDFQGRPYKKVYSDGYTETTLYDSCGRTVQTINSEGRKILYQYDSGTGKMKYHAVKRNESDSIDFSADFITEFESGYERYENTVAAFEKKSQYVNGEKIELRSTRTRRDGKKSWWTGDGRTSTTTKVSENDGEEIETTTSFDGSTQVNTSLDGILVSSEHSVFGLSTFFYDEFNRSIGKDHVENGQTVSERNALDNAGNIIAATETIGISARTTTYTYDLLGRKISETTPEGKTINYTYDAKGKLVSVSGDAYRQTFTYDSQGRISSQTTYCNTDAPQTTNFVYDNCGRLIQKVYPDGSLEGYTYRGDGRIATRTNAGGDILTYTYSLAGEQTRTDFSEGGGRAFSYNQNGAIIAVEDSGCNFTYVLDTHGKVLTETAGGRRLQREYDAFQRQTSLKLDGSALSNTHYDDQGRIDSINTGIATLHYAYRSGAGSIGSSSWQIGDAAPFLVFNNEYDVYNRLTRISANNSAEVDNVLNDDNQLITSLFGNGGIWNYAYDRLGQLSSAQRQDAHGTAVDSMSYAYDGIGNRTTATENSSTVNYTANLLNQYTAINDDVPTYDADGNMISGGGWSFTWDMESRLTGAVRENIRLEFTYDYLGRRIAKKVFDGDALSKHEKYAYDANKLVAVYDGLNGDALLRTFVWQPISPVVPLCMTSGGNSYYYLVDANRNVTGLFDQTGARVATYRYGAFGQLLESSGALASDNPLRFSSELYDPETELICYHYRYYSPKFGRWLSRDPLGEEGGVNLYAFVRNAPTNQYDQEGLWSADIHLTATIAWAKEVGFSNQSANRIGEFDEGVDGGSWGLGSEHSFLPILGDQSYHFNRTPNGATDSRLEHTEYHLKQAKFWCNANNLGGKYWDRNGYLHDFEENAFNAAAELGIALHPAQDWVAHGDYAIYNEGAVGTFHNSCSPQIDLLYYEGTVWKYPDLPTLDAIDGPQGRAAGQQAMHTVLTMGGVSVRLYANYKFGTLRYKLTRNETLDILKKYYDWLKTSGTCKCKQYFGVIEE